MLSLTRIFLSTAYSLYLILQVIMRPNNWDWKITGILNLANHVSPSLLLSLSFFLTFSSFRGLQSIFFALPLFSSLFFCILYFLLNFALSPYWFFFFLSILQYFSLSLFFCFHILSSSLVSFSFPLFSPSFAFFIFSICFSPLSLLLLFLSFLLLSFLYFLSFIHFSFFAPSLFLYILLLYFSLLSLSLSFFLLPSFSLFSFSLSLFSPSLFLYLSLLSFVSHFLFSLSLSLLFNCSLFPALISFSFVCVSCS